MVDFSASHIFALGPSLSESALSRGKKVYPLTSARFFAAFLVVLHHSAPSFLPVFASMSVQHIPHGFAGRIFFSFAFSVSFFYLLSGYVLGAVYLREGRAVDKRRFFAARFARIYPLYLVMLVLDSPELLTAEVRRYGVTIGLVRSAKIFAANALVLQAWSQERLLRMNAPIWSLSGEIFFYLCFPVLGVLLWKLRGPRLWMTALVLYIVGQAVVWAMRPYLSQQTLLYLPLLHLSTFALGVLLARWQSLQRQRKAVIRAWQVNVVLGLSVGGAVLSVPLLPYFHVTEPYNNGLLAPVCAGFIWALSARQTVLTRWLCGDWLVALGNGSYALYLIHFPILLLFLHLHWSRESLYPIYLALCTGLSVLSFYYFEMPARLWLLARLDARSLETAEMASSA
jgi:peptidoglycan/LPS O-acetylase OafA/YrhL